MLKLGYCACGCGKRVRAALPPRAAQLRQRLHLEDETRKRRERWERQLEAARQHVLGLFRAEPEPEPAPQVIH